MYKSIKNNFGIITRTINQQRVGICKFKLNDKTCYVNNLEVNEQFRKRNIGSELLQELEKYCKEKGMNDIVLIAHQEVLGTLTEFYEKNNYVQTAPSTATYDDGEKTFDLINMKKKLK